MRISRMLFMLVPLCVITWPMDLPATRLLTKPYRVLVIVERWSDPGGVLVDYEKDDFQPVVALLKAWSVPFDIFRLDQQHLDGSYLFDREERIRYGVVIWLADHASYQGQNLAALEDAARAGTSLLAVNSRCLDPVLERLLGLEFKSLYRADDVLRVTQPHFITRELAQTMGTQDVSEDKDRFWMGTQGAAVLIAQGLHPVLTVNQLDKDVAGVWMGAAHLAALRESPYWRSLFFRALVWSLGYVVQPDVDYSHRMEIEIDDWGTSDKGYLSYWRYLEPSEETLREHLIASLQRHHAVASANVITGYVDRKTKRILSPWTQEFTDSYGLHQNFSSTQRGLKAAVAAGVLEIQSHGWTHMQPDLDSPPGPWWTADLAGEASAGGWYTEFGDRRRGTEMPAVVQLFHMQRSFEYLKKDFGQRPLEMRPGGGTWSKSYANQTALLAARAGFGIFQAEPSSFYYLDRDLVLDMNGIGAHAPVSYDRPIHAELWPPHVDGPVMAIFHDRDIAFRPDFIERLFAALPAGYETVSTNQYVGFLHARIESAANHGWQLKFLFDEPYCAYFDSHPSSWRVWLSDPWRDELRSLHEWVITVDGKTLRTANISDLLHENLTIDIPAGLGEHVWTLSRAR
jgi:peptidoglycan/xylan/chitin deacetylase (PgdA/CDA1 family)